MTKEIILAADTPLAPVTILKAGVLTCLYELGRLRYIRNGDTEIIRMMYAAVRDEHWGTLPCTITDEQLVIGENSFRVQYTAVYRQDIPVYKMQYCIEGRPDNTILFLIKGEALAGFRSNRIGLCVHHPLKECHGQPVTITRPDETLYEGSFPVQVGPWQPFHGISKMQWTLPGHTCAELVFKGDIFETEDQRNWSDSSYKTYSTPLALPFPVAVQAGDRKEQEMNLTLMVPGTSQIPQVKKDREEKIPFPAIGYCRAAVQPSLSDEVIACLRKIPFHHYRVMLAMDDQGWQGELTAALAEAVRLHTRLALVVIFSDAYKDELERLLPLLAEKKSLLFSLLPLQKDHAVTPAALLAHVYPIIKKRLPALQTGYGTDQFFTELNRHRPADLLFDFISFSCHPQVHASDSRSLLENLESQADIITTAGSFANGKPVFVSPVTLKDRYYLPAPDARQYSCLAAWWMLLSMQQLSMAGSITYFELLGEAGLLQSEPGATRLSPIYEVLVSIQAFQPRWIIKRYAGTSVAMDGLLLENAAGDRLFFKAPETYRLFACE